MPETPQERVGWVVENVCGEVSFIKSYEASEVTARAQYVMLHLRWELFGFSAGHVDEIYTEEDIQESKAWLIPPHRDRGRCTRLHDAIFCGHEACVRALAPTYDGDVRLKEACVVDAAAYGHLDVLRCLVVDMRWPMDGASMWAAARTGRLDCLKFAIDNRTSMSFHDAYVRDLGDFLDMVHDEWFLSDSEPRCYDVLTTLQTVDGFLRDVAPLLDYPEDAAKMCELDKSVLRLMRTKFYTDYPALDGRPARLPRILRRSPRLRRKRNRA